MVDLQPLEADPRYSTAREELQAIEARITQAEQRRKIAQARARGQQPTRSLAERAKALISGGQIVSLPPASEAEAADEELQILNGARIKANERLEQLRSEISFEVCQRFAEPSAEALRAALDAVTQLHTALEVNRVIRGKLVGAGYQLSEAALPIHLFPEGAALGDPQRRSLTPAGRFRGWLEARGIV